MTVSAVTSSHASNPVAIVTGATRGIGRETALAFAKDGTCVVVHYRKNHHLAEQVAAQCRDHGVGAVCVGTDLNDESAAATLLQAAESLGTLTVLVNNAGIALTKLLIDTSLEEWQGMLRVNLTSAFLLMKAALPPMITNGYGRIINLSSVFGINGGSCESAYSAAKGGLIALTKAVAKEVAATGVTVNVVAPGAVDTDMLASLSPMDKSALCDEIPAGRLGYASEVASAIRYLASPGASYITGQVLSPNGGWWT